MNSEKDDFWDVSKLVPKSAKARASQHFSSPRMADVVVEPARDVASGENKITVQRDKDASFDVETYEPDFVLIKKVTVRRMADRYDFYGSFRKSALLYFDVRGAKCEFEPFFSYMPQYSQMNTKQKNYYFFWRDEIGRGRFIKTDYSYINLFVYEILNLPDKIPPEKGLSFLLKIWNEYKRDFPRIHSQLSLWVQDYCLLYRLKCPTGEMKELMFDAIASSDFKEFYLSDMSILSDDSVEALIAYLSYYDWRRGKHAGGETGEIYKKCLLGAMGKLLQNLWENGVIRSANSETARFSRQSFKGALCTHSIKSILDVEYYPISHDEHIRNAVTEALRYTENKLRALIGVKSRLTVKAIDAGYKAIIDGYFDQLLKKTSKERRAASRPEYEKLYEAETIGVSKEGADEIELASWEITKRLVGDELEDDTETVTTGKPTDNEIIKEEKNGETYGLSEAEIGFIRAVLNGERDKSRDILRSISKTDGEISDRINEVFFDNFGDVILEIGVGSVQIIEDYREDVEAWLSKITV